MYFKAHYIQDPISQRKNIVSGLYTQKEIYKRRKVFECLVIDLKSWCKSKTNSLNKLIIITQSLINNKKMQQSSLFGGHTGQVSAESGKKMMVGL